MSESIDRYAVFGNPINHSKSPILQMEFAKQTLQKIMYTAECVEPENFSNAVTHFFSSGGKGLNITVPFKLDAFTLADNLTVRAKRPGAVNTLLLNDGKILGDNTDGVGLIDDIEKNLQWRVKDKSILILGAGGAVCGVLESVLNAKPKNVIIANRTLSKAQTLVERFNDLGHIFACDYSNVTSSFDLIINGTSASLHNDLPPLPENILCNAAGCYDMMYSKEKTPFLLWAQQQADKYQKNILTSDGLGMLVCQGAESFFQWRKVRPKTRTVINKLRGML